LFKLIKPGNLDLQDAACLHVVNILSHPTSSTTTRATQEIMVNAPKKGPFPLPAGTYGNSTKQIELLRYQMNTGKSALEVERFRALGALHSLRSEMELSPEKQYETHFLCNEEKENQIDDLVGRETAVGRMCIVGADTAILQDQEHMRIL
jgi:hypothetical protein